MENLIIEATKNTPYIFFRPDGYINISGRSIHEDPVMFYRPLVDWIKQYCFNSGKDTTIDIKLEYFNSGSSRFLLDILKRLHTLRDKGLKVKVNWHFEEGDDDILERGQYFASILKTRFDFIEEYEEEG